MLSILIPTYNYNVLPLVTELINQAKKENILYEVIVLDDASNSELNTKNECINSLDNCSFEVLPKNIGRSAIRNLLAKKATFEWLLFLDADVLPTSKDFINIYIEEINKNKASVFLGGIAYKEDVNSNRIRWKLGKKGEEQTLELRSKNPFKYFFTANLLIDKLTFNSVKFDQNLIYYGYEDLLFSKNLEVSKITLKHIDNPIYHLGIDDNASFIKKTKLALENLSFLVNSEKIKSEDTKIYKTFFKLKKLGITTFLAKFLPFFEKKSIKKSSLIYFNLFRLAYLYKLFKNSQ